MNYDDCDVAHELCPGLFRLGAGPAATGYLAVIYKPLGATSHQVVDQVRGITGVKRVGHAGTLDPLATGVLVVGIGRAATRQLDGIVRKEKEYLATVLLGTVSDTDDEEGVKTPVAVTAWPDEAAVRAALADFTGEIVQLPPAHSAVKIAGRPAYKYARAGQQAVLRPRQVTVKLLDLCAYEPPQLRLRAVTGSGVYIRSLARDLGAALGTGAYLTALERTRVGEFDKAQALTLEALAEAWRRRQ